MNEFYKGQIVIYNSDRYVVREVKTDYKGDTVLDLEPVAVGKLYGIHAYSCKPCN